MVHRVKETSKVDANRIAVVLVYYLHHSHQCLIRSPIRTEAVAAVAGLAVIDLG